MIPLWQAFGACVLTGVAGYGLRAALGTWRDRRAAARAVAWWHAQPRPLNTDATAPLYTVPLYGPPNVTARNADGRAHWLAKERYEQ